MDYNYNKKDSKIYTLFVIFYLHLTVIDNHVSCMNKQKERRGTFNSLCLITQVGVCKKWSVDKDRLNLDVSLACNSM